MHRKKNIFIIIALFFIPSLSHGKIFRPSNNNETPKQPFAYQETSNRAEKENPLQLEYRIDDSEEKENDTQYTIKETRKKSWTFFVHIGGNNNLHKYVAHNLKQMQEVGSNEHINIIAQIDRYGENTIKRVLVRQNKILIVQELPKNYSNVSGTSESLFDSMKWAVENYPAEHYALILWDHGSSIIDPHRFGRFGHRISDEEIARIYDIDTKGKLYLDKNDLRVNDLDSDRGIIFNDGYDQYIDNAGLTFCLKRISDELLDGKKIDIVGMDACLMAMLEVATQVRNWVNYFVGSQELELGSGWNYAYALEKFKNETTSPQELCKQIVDAYRREYLPITYDFTQSAYDLSKIDKLEENVDQLSKQLILLLHGEEGKLALHAIRNIRQSTTTTTWFASNTTIDLHHFYMSMLNVFKKIRKERNKQELYAPLIQILHKGLALIHSIVIRNQTGSYLSNAQGISIYFPTRNIHSSYTKTAFAQITHWAKFLSTYHELQSSQH